MVHLGINLIGWSLWFGMWTFCAYAGFEMMKEGKFLGLIGGMTFWGFSSGLFLLPSTLPGA